MQTLRAMVLVLVTTVGLGTVTLVADCEVPAFLATGKTYMVFSLGDTTVLEIDRKTCWVKVAIKGPSFAGPPKETIGWLNLEQTLLWQEAQPPSESPNPGQRR